MTFNAIPADFHLKQTPAPGGCSLRFCGENVEIALSVSESVDGDAYLRTNLGNAFVKRREIIAAVEEDRPRLDTDWHDLPMERISDTEFIFRAALDETGVFEAKAFFLPSGSNDLVWPDGENLTIKVEPASLAVGNTIYTAFVRQFGPNKKEGATEDADEETINMLEERGYAVIPGSGKFRDLIGELDHIVYRMGFRFIQLLPIHPAPTTYARMGRFGSPFAALDFLNVDRGLAEFDSRTTPLDQFLELVQEIHRRDGRVLLDIALNHTGWASQLQIHHPEWFLRNPDGTFRSPGAWGVVWADLSELDYSHKSLWRYVADVFLYWCAKGVDGFRCDAGYMIPFEVWEYVVAKVRENYPDTVFLLEGLGGRVSTTRQLLGRAGLNWAYSEIFQNYNRDELEKYLPASFAIEAANGLLVNFAETHDNNRLAARSRSYARMRTALCALTSQAATFGITNGVEWFAEQKVDVHEGRSLNWGSEDNLVEWLARLNRIATGHPAFQNDSRRTLIEQDDGNSIALLRETDNPDHSILILVNLSDIDSEPVNWRTPPALDSEVLHDLLNGGQVTPVRNGSVSRLVLPPGEVRCLGRYEWTIGEEFQKTPFSAPLSNWRYKAKYLEVLRAIRDDGNPLPPVSPVQVDDFRIDPTKTMSGLSNSSAPIHIELQLPRDLRRVVMVPPGMFLFVRSSEPFMLLELNGGLPVYCDRSLPSSGDGHFVLIPPESDLSAPQRRTLEIHIFEAAADGPSIRTAEILRLPPYPAASIATCWDSDEIEDPDLCALAVNRNSSCAYVRAAWSDIRSQYDALLAFNPSTEFPGDRRILWTRCRCWVVCKDYSREVGLENLVEFSAGAGLAPVWRFALPVGRGMAMPLKIELSFSDDTDKVGLTFTREKHLKGNPYPIIDPDESVNLIVRPDIENRNFHSKTKAFLGPEDKYGNAIECIDDGFVFRPADTAFKLTSSASGFVREDEWLYMVEHPIDAERGLDGSSDLFSPGYFRGALNAGDSIRITGEVLPERASAPAGEYDGPTGAEPGSNATTLELSQAARNACRDFIVKRNSGHSVIAGYPWFLDWGRDTLIALRGIIAEGWHDLALETLVEFSRFEDRGTIPNMIHGDDASNRDTSDAPLWLFVACRDLVGATGKTDVLGTDCGGRTIGTVLVSIAENYCAGTPNGIVVDDESGLVYSPEHFTWMDTQHPAGTPRSGYPIEIQALWSAALGFLLEMEGTDKARWKQLLNLVNQSIRRLYPRAQGGLADCLHADSAGMPADECRADDHCRPNQLLALTLGDIVGSELEVEVVEACWSLLVPGAIRSLADAPTAYELPVRGLDNALLNDPSNPYWGSYSGDEDTRRKPAYHNGTAWVWQFPSFCEALVKAYGDEMRAAALSLLGSTAELFNHGCAGHLPEILDGDAPHRQRGCTAQAWSATEVARVIRLIWC